MSRKTTLAYELGVSLAEKGEDLLNLLAGLDHGAGPLAEQSLVDLHDTAQFAAFLRGYADGTEA